jgi:hypothetical protein
MRRIDLQRERVTRPVCGPRDLWRLPEELRISEKMGIGARERELSKKRVSAVSANERAAEQ